MKTTKTSVQKILALFIIVMLLFGYLYSKTSVYADSPIVFYEDFSTRTIGQRLSIRNVVGSDQNEFFANLVNNAHYRREGTNMYLETFSNTNQNLQVGTSPISNSADSLHNKLVKVSFSMRMDIATTKGEVDADGASILPTELYLRFNFNGFNWDSIRFIKTLDGDYGLEILEGTTYVEYTGFDLTDWFNFTMIIDNQTNQIRRVYLFDDYLVASDVLQRTSGTPGYPIRFDQNNFALEVRLRERVADRTSYMDLDHMKIETINESDIPAIGDVPILSNISSTRVYESSPSFTLTYPDEIDENTIHHLSVENSAGEEVIVSAAISTDPTKLHVTFPHDLAPGIYTLLQEGITYGTESKTSLKTFTFKTAHFASYFSEYEIGDQPIIGTEFGQWSNISSPESLSVTNSLGNQVLKIQATNEPVSLTTNVLDFLKDDAHIAFKIRPGATTLPGVFGSLTITNADNNLQWTPLRFNGGGIEYYNASSQTYIRATSYSSIDFYHIGLSLNVTNQTYNLYIDGELFALNVPMPRLDQSFYIGIHQVNFNFTNQTFGTTNATAYLDDIFVSSYQPALPIVDLDLRSGHTTGDETLELTGSLANGQTLLVSLNGGPEEVITAWDGLFAKTYTLEDGENHFYYRAMTQGGLTSALKRVTVYLFHGYETGNYIINGTFDYGLIAFETLGTGEVAVFEEAGNPYLSIGGTGQIIGVTQQMNVDLHSDYELSFKYRNTGSSEIRVVFDGTPLTGYTPGFNVSAWQTSSIVFNSGSQDLLVLELLTQSGTVEIDDITVTKIGEAYYTYSAELDRDLNTLHALVENASSAILSYEWLLSTSYAGLYTPINNANQASFSIAAAQLNKFVMLRVVLDVDLESLSIIQSEPMFIDDIDLDISHEVLKANINYSAADGRYSEAHYNPYDTLQIGLDHVVVRVNGNVTEALGLMDSDGPEGLGTDFQTPKVNGTAVLDFDFSSSVFDSHRSLKDLTIFFHGTGYQVDYYVSLIDSPDLFMYFTNSSTTRVSNRHSYHRVHNIEDGINVHTLRLVISNEHETNIRMGEIDINFHSDSETIKDIKDVLLNHISMTSIFSDYMMFRHNVPVNVWGYGGGADGNIVTVSINGQTKTAVVENYMWSATLDPIPAGTDYTLSVVGPYNTIALNSVAAGEVFIAAGQSNMQRTIRTLDGQNPSDSDYIFPNYGTLELPHTPNTNIRLFNQSSRGSRNTELIDVFNGSWNIADSVSVYDFSAVGYFFARELQKQLDVPVGIIFAAVGGSRVQAWLAKTGIIGTDDSALYGEEAEAIEYYNGETHGASTISSTNNYNGMIKPLQPYTISGVLWYQGESNLGDDPIYFNMFNSLVNSWRAGFEDENLPFLVVQLAPHKRDVNNNHHRFSNTQTDIMHMLPNTYITIISDTVTEANFGNIHPQNKVPVGDRLAWLAAEMLYGMDIEGMPPLFESMEIDGDKIIVTFSNVGSGLKIGSGTSLLGFELSSDGVNFVAAQAQIVAPNKIELTASGVNQPIHARYNYFVEPFGNLYGGQNLPAGLFATDLFKYHGDRSVVATNKAETIFISGYTNTPLNLPQTVVVTKHNAENAQYPVTWLVNSFAEVGTYTVKGHIYSTDGFFVVLAIVTVTEAPIEPGIRVESILDPMIFFYRSGATITTADLLAHAPYVTVLLSNGAYAEVKVLSWSSPVDGISVGTLDLTSLNAQDIINPEQLTAFLTTAQYNR